MYNIYLKKNLKKIKQTNKYGLKYSTPLNSNQTIIEEWPDVNILFKPFRTITHNNNCDSPNFNLLNL